MPIYKAVVRDTETDELFEQYRRQASPDKACHGLMDYIHMRYGTPLAELEPVEVTLTPYERLSEVPSPVPSEQESS